MIQQISRNTSEFPDPREANPDGIVAWGGDLHPYRLIQAYQSGIFPWYAKNEPILWWSPNPRLIMELDDIKISKSLKKSIKKFHYKFNTNFSSVIQRCATKPRKEQMGTWIQEEVINAYSLLHEMGVAHSIEAYKEDTLVGGLYGLVIGKVFCGESMFSNETDASKAAYVVLVKHLKAWGYDFIDCQVPTEHLKSLGAREVDREYFLYRLEEVNNSTLAHNWSIQEELYT